MAKQHDWNTLQNYLEVHENVLWKYSAHFLIVPKYKITKYTSQFWQMDLLKVRIRTRKGTEITLDIEKEIEIDDSVPKRPRARTGMYRYVASKPNPDGRCILRCDSPHEDATEPGSPDHHKYHHKHDYRTSPQFIVKFPDDGWPHASDFLEEVVSEL